MINQQQPITPTPELVRNWARFQNEQDPEALWLRIGTLAARWGADQELEACCEWLDKRFRTDPFFAKSLSNAARTARRPKPPSLKKQALLALDLLISGSLCSNSVTTESTIRRALEALDD